MCNAGIKKQQTKETDQQTIWYDIAQKGIDAQPKLLSIEYTRKYLHAIDQYGNMHIGIDAFILIWSNTPNEHWKARLASNLILHPILKSGYRIFANILYAINRLLKNW